MVDSSRPAIATSSSVDSQMLSALEFLHYCRRFQDTLFAFVFERATRCTNVLMDLRVLLSARIGQVIFCAAGQHLIEAVETWNRAGDRFSVIKARREELDSPDFLTHVRSEIEAARAALVMIDEYPSEITAREQLEAAIIQCAVDLGAKKIFFPAGEAGLTINGKFRAYPTVQEVQAAIREGAEFNIPLDRVRFLIAQQELHNVDIVLVEARRGAIYEEVFTHAGSGTLFTCEYPNILRVANETDVRDIMAIMQPYINDGSLKAVSEDELLSMIPSFMVYSVNGQIIAAAALVEYGDSCELSKLCTLPRFQARGRARALVRALLVEAEKRGKVAVFALTVNSYVADFFERVGFKPIERESLPAEWRAGYDFSRNSRAFVYPIKVSQ